MNFNGYIATPSQLFNNRCLTGLPSIDEDVEKSVLTSGQSVRELMKQVSRHRLTDTPTLSQNISQRKRPFRINEKCLVWSEHILSKKLLKSNILKVKLAKHWQLATVRKQIGEQYMVEDSNGRMRKVHQRQMKQYSG